MPRSAHTGFPHSTAAKPACQKPPGPAWRLFLLWGPEKKMGLKVRSEKRDDGERAYSISRADSKSKSALPTQPPPSTNPAAALLLSSQPRAGYKRDLPAAVKPLEVGDRRAPGIVGQEIP